MTAVLSTEEHIKAVAKKVFVEKGYAATTTRDIAEAADTNLALINYYFRSKEKLFKQVFEETHHDFFKSLLEIFNKDLPLKDKFIRLIDNDFEFLMQNPDISVFVLNEMRQNGDEYIKRVMNKEALINSLFFKQMEVAIANGEMIPISPFEAIIIVVGNIQFPFIARPMYTGITGADDRAYKDFLFRHKERIKDMVLSYLFIH